jgi:ribosome-binding factor A
MPGRRRDNRGVAPYARSLRVNQVLRQILAEELERLADADERLRLVTITSVDTAPDLRNATVFLSSMSDDAAEALGERRVQLQRSMGRQVRMKRTPSLSFEVDPAVIAGSRVEDVLRRIHDSEQQHGNEGERPGGEGTGERPDGESKGSGEQTDDRQQPDGGHDKDHLER